MRNLSPFIQGLFTTAAATGERSFRTQVGLSITLNTGVVYNVGSGAIVINSISRRGASVNISPLIFEARAIAFPSFRHSQSQAPDAGEVALINLDYIISQLIPEPTRLFENAKAKVYLAFPKTDGNYEGLLYFVGRIRSVSGDDEEAPLSLISDMSDKNVHVGEEITQRCLNELGDYIVGGRCGATHLPGGATCSKDFYDEVNGCIFWGQMHAFWGIPFINPTGLVAGYGGTLGDPWDYPPPDGCVDPSSWIKKASGVWMRGYDFKAGDQTIDARGRIGTIKLIEEKYVIYRYLIEASNGAKLRCSADHPVTTDFNDDIGRQAYTLRPYRDFLNGDIPEPDRMLTEVHGNHEVVDRWKMYPIAAGKVLKFSMEEGGSKNYIAGIEPNLGIEGHNRKPDPILLN